MPNILIERAPAKVNLTLHILGRGMDGWHALESLVAFSRGGDMLALTPGKPLALTVSGPSALAAGPENDNLVLRAALNFKAHYPRSTLGAFQLVKRLPVAAGIGGGSSDAAAALRLLARTNEVPISDLVLAAQATGADVPVCLSGRAKIMTGRGERLGPPLGFPPLVALIVNPGVPVATKDVFARLGLAPGASNEGARHPEFSPNMPLDDLIAALRKGRNDMEGAACVIAPIIGDVLAILAAAPGCRLARMSGSGATCFGLFKDRRTAMRARAAIQRAHPAWWVKACILN
jgi:4-diphosphocytidyl-2-C-methyl-D-erythritol kinase